MRIVRPHDKEKILEINFRVTVTERRKQKNGNYLNGAMLSCWLSEFNSHKQLFQNLDEPVKSHN